MTTTGLILLLIAVVFWGYYARLSLKLEMERDELRHKLKHLDWVRGQTDRLGDGCKQVVYHEFGHILVGHRLQGCYHCKD